MGNLATMDLLSVETCCDSAFGQKSDIKDFNLIVSLHFFPLVNKKNKSWLDVNHYYKSIAPDFF